MRLETDIEERYAANTVPLCASYSILLNALESDSVHCAFVILLLLCFDRCHRRIMIEWTVLIVKCTAMVCDEVSHVRDRKALHM